MNAFLERLFPGIFSGKRMVAIPEERSRQGLSLPRRSVKPVVCLSDSSSLVQLECDLRENGYPLHAMVHECPKSGTDYSGAPKANLSPWFTADVRRLAREISGRRIGLVLSSGGAKGLAHIGVIQVLEENGVEIDIIAGSSMGAYVAAVWAYGGDGQLMEHLAREMEGRGKLWRIVDPVFPPRQGFIRGKAVRHRLEHSIGRRHFCDLKRPLRIVATDLETLEGTVFDHGEVAEAVHASSAIPGVCVPVNINGRTYIDGGVSDPLPIDILQDMGVQRIIAVNTIPPPDYLQHCLERERNQRVKESEWAKAKRVLNQRLNYFARGNILDIMLRSIHGAQIRIAEQACNRADIVLRPLSCDARWHDFNNPERYITLGREVTEKNLEQIQTLLKQNGSDHHEKSNAPDTMATAA